MVDCIFEVDDGGRGRWRDGERDRGCPHRLGGISEVRKEAWPLISEAGGDVFGGVI